VRISDPASPRSVKDKGSRSARRKVASLRAICPLSRSWSKPARWRIPCRTRTFTSAAAEWPRRRALSRAISAEIAISPTNGIPRSRFDEDSEGKDKTSVDLFLPRKRSFKERISPLVVMKTSTVPLSLADLHARTTNRRSDAALSPAIFLLSNTTERPLSWIEHENKRG